MLYQGRMQYNRNHDMRVLGMQKEGCGPQRMRLSSFIHLYLCYKMCLKHCAQSWSRLVVDSGTPFTELIVVILYKNEHMGLGL